MSLGREGKVQTRFRTHRLQGAYGGAPSFPPPPRERLLSPGSGGGAEARGGGAPAAAELTPHRPRSPQAAAEQSQSARPTRHRRLSEIPPLGPAPPRAQSPEPGGAHAHTGASERPLSSGPSASWASMPVRPRRPGRHPGAHSGPLERRKETAAWRVS